MLSREIVRGIVIGVLLVLGLGGVASGQEADPEAKGVAQRILKKVIAEAVPADEDQFAARFMEALTEELGDAHPSVLALKGKLAVELYQQGDYAGARQIFEPILTALLETEGEEHPQTLTVRNNLAQVLKAQGDFGRARELEEEVFSTRRRVLGGDHPDTLTSMGNLASTLYMQGDYVRARELLEEVFSTSRRVLGGDHPDTLTSMGNLASTLYMQGDYVRARELLEEVFSTSRRVLGGDHPDTLMSMGNLANILREQGEFSRAREMGEKVVSALRRVLGPDHPITLNAMSNLASTLYRQEIYDRAAEIEEHVLTFQTRILGPAHPDTLTTTYNLASNLYRMRAYGRARVLFEKIIEIWETAPGLEYKWRTSSGARTLSFLASTYLELQMPGLAASRYLQALDALEAQAKRSADSENLRSTYKAGFEFIYLNSLKTLAHLGRHDEAHHVLERFRAHGFLTMVAERDIVFSEIPPEFEERRRDLAAQYDASIRARDKLYSRQDRDQLFAVLKHQQEIRRERERLEAEIRRQAPGVADLKDPRPLQVEEIRQSLEPGTLMLSYAVGAEGTILFTLARDEDIKVHSLEVGEGTLWTQSREYFSQLQGTVSAELEASRLEMGKWLYKQLLKPAATEIEESKRLLIIADGPLHYLPFSALIRPIDVNGRNWQYLVEWKPVHSVLSATVYAQLQKWRPEPDQGEVGLQVAAFGDPSYPGDGSKGRGNLVVRSAIERGIFDGLDPLPYTEHEVREIERLFPTGSARTFLGADATEESAKALDKKVRIAHFAAHGVTDPFTQLDSFIALSIFDDQDENGLLQAWEIYERVRLNADLVVLSACQTAFGPETDGEGLMSLSRAFQYAGARTVMASLWSVNDASTAELMIRFYKHLRAGKAKDEALRAAQLEFLDGPIEIKVDDKVVEKDYSSPFHWAAFQVIGDWK